MAENNKQQVDKTKLYPMKNNEQPKDFLQRFFSPQEKNHKETTLMVYQEKQDEEPDLNLGLSLGGIYGEKPKDKTLTRSLSIVGALTLNKETGGREASPPKFFLSLARSTSLPAVSEQDQRRAILKELARRRVEAAQRLVRRRRATGGNEMENSPPPEPMPSSPSRVAAWAAASAARSPALRRALFKIKTLTLLSGERTAEELEALAAEMDASGLQFLPNHTGTQPMATLGMSANGKAAEAGLENPTKKAKFSHNGFEDDWMDVMRRMPSVTTTGDGPNGRKIEGFLYKYLKGQVSIVCICHGSFLSPAEFVKHAGGREVQNPMKHISVSCASLSS